MTHEPIPVARAYYAGSRIIVPCCPYCGRQHTHLPPPDGALQRLADCLRGEYVLDIQSAPVSEASRS